MTTQPSSNLLSRLRDVGRARGVELYHTLASEAADEIERVTDDAMRLRELRDAQRTELERLRAALRWIEDNAFYVERIELAERATSTLRAADETAALELRQSDG